MKASDYSELTREARRLALAAGHEIMRIYAAGTTTRLKADNSPVTDADEAADRLIVAGLDAAFPGIPVISEESIETTGLAESGIPTGRFWLVDPLDGTREFISRNGEFTVNIGLIENGRPILGALHLPVLGECYVGETGVGAALWPEDEEPTTIATRDVPATGPVILASRSHLDPQTEAWIADIASGTTTHAGSALKFAVLARGDADLYPRFGRTMEWDTAAGHALLEAAGGVLSGPDDEPFRYGKPGFDNPHFIARGRPAGQ